jgi:hypothetical protein
MNTATIIPTTHGYGLIVPGTAICIGHYPTPQDAERVAHINGWEVYTK